MCSISVSKGLFEMEKKMEISRTANHGLFLKTTKICFYWYIIFFKWQKNKNEQSLRLYPPVPLSYASVHCIMDAFEINHETAYLAVLFVFSMESLRFSAVVLKDDKPCNTIQEKSMTCNKYCSDVIGKCNKYCSDVIGKCNKYCSDVIGKSIKFNTFM